MKPYTKRALLAASQHPTHGLLLTQLTVQIVSVTRQISDMRRLGRHSEAADDVVRLNKLKAERDEILDLFEERGNGIEANHHKPAIGTRRGAYCIPD